jgi:hypothetical protein
LVLLLLLPFFSSNLLLPLFAVNTGEDDGRIDGCEKYLWNGRRCLRGGADCLESDDASVENRTEKEEGGCKEDDVEGNVRAETLTWKPRRRLFNDDDDDDATRLLDMPLETPGHSTTPDKARQ